MGAEPGYYKVTINLTLFFLVINSASSQNNQADSLMYININFIVKENIKKGSFNENIILLKNELLDVKYRKSFKPKIYNDIASNYGMGGKIDSAKYYTELSINHCDDNKIRTRDYYDALYNKSNILILKKEADEALNISYTLLSYYKKSNPDLYLNTLINISNVLIDLRSFEESYDYLILAEEQSIKHANYSALYRVYHNFAQLEYYRNLRTVNEKCISYGELSLKTAIKTNKQNTLADAKSNLGTYYWKTGNYPIAIELLISADSIYSQKNINKTAVLTSLSKAYYMTGDYEKSKFYFEKIRPSNDLLNNIENKILLSSIENRSHIYNDFVAYKSLLDSNIIEETKLQSRALDKKFKLLEKDNEIKRLNQINLQNELNARSLDIEFFKQSTENEILVNEKLEIENSLKDKSITESKNKLEIFSLSSKKKSALKLKDQENIIYGSIFF